MLLTAGKEGSNVEEATDGGDDGVLELAPHYQYISGLRFAPARLLHRFIDLNDKPVAAVLHDRHAEHHLLHQQDKDHSNAMTHRVDAVCRLCYWC